MDLSWENLQFILRSNSLYNSSSVQIKSSSSSQPSARLTPEYVADRVVIIGVVIV